MTTSTDAAESSSFSAHAPVTVPKWKWSQLWTFGEYGESRDFKDFREQSPPEVLDLQQRWWIKLYQLLSFLGQGKNNQEINCYATNDFMICPYIVFLLYRRSAWCWWHLVKATDTKMLPVLPCTLCAASQHRCLCSTSWCLSIHFNVSYVAVIHDSSRVHTIDTISLRSFLFT